MYEEPLGVDIATLKIDKGLVCTVLSRGQVRLFKVTSLRQDNVLGMFITPFETEMFPGVKKMSMSAETLRGRILDVRALPADKKPPSPSLTPEQCHAIWAKALEAGDTAARTVQVAPMHVQQHANPLDDNSAVVKTYVENEGVCGFAWIKIRPANSSFARWAKEQGLGQTSDYEGGLTIWTHGYGQSYTRKRAFASAAAKVLQGFNITAYADGRLD